LLSQVQLVPLHLGAAKRFLAARDVLECLEVGLYNLNPVDPYSLKAPGFNP
jgi:hypothetical protein